MQNLYSSLANVKVVELNPKSTGMANPKLQESIQLKYYHKSAREVNQINGTPLIARRQIDGTPLLAEDPRHRYSNRTRKINRNKA